VGEHAEKDGTTCHYKQSVSNARTGSYSYPVRRQEHKSSADRREAERQRRVAPLGLKGSDGQGQRANERHGRTGRDRHPEQDRKPDCAACHQRIC
jgi:hypothetical protein